MKDLEVLTGCKTIEIKDELHSMIVESALLIEERETMMKRVTILNALYDMIH